MDKRIESRAKNAEFRELLTESEYFHELFEVVKNTIQFSPQFKIPRWHNSAPHRPIDHLNYFFNAWEGLLLPHMASQFPFEREEIKTTFFGEDDVYIVPQLKGNPADIFASLALKGDMESSVIEKVSQAKVVYVTGFLSVASAFDILQFLERSAFVGTVYFIDQSSVPLRLLEKYLKLTGLQFSFSINLNIQGNIFEKVLQGSPKNSFLSVYPSADIVISDIITPHLPTFYPEVDSIGSRYTSLLQLVAFLTKQKSWWISRDIIEPNGLVADKKRNIVHDNNQPFIAWLSELSGLSQDSLATEVDKATATRWGRDCYATSTEAYSLSKEGRRQFFHNAGEILTAKSADLSRLFLTRILEASGKVPGIIDSYEMRNEDIAA